MKEGSGSCLLVGWCGGGGGLCDRFFGAYFAICWRRVVGDWAAFGGGHGALSLSLAGGLMLLFCVGGFFVGVGFMGVFSDGSGAGGFLSW